MDNKQQPREEKQVPQENPAKSQTPKDTGYDPDYSNAGLELDELEREHRKGNRQGNSSIPLDNDETIGNP